MKIEIDTERQTLTTSENAQSNTVPLYSDEAFYHLSRVWKKVGWNQRYSYTFTWLGRPMIQLPEDAIRIQEVIWQLKPDVIIETGVAHGGSLIFYANVLQAIGAGEVIGIDIDIRPHNRREIEEHPLSQRIHLIEGDSAAESTLKSVRELVGAKKVMVILDSDHSKRHVYKELEAYRDIVSSGSYIIVTDGVMIELSDVPNGNPAWDIDNPVKAVEEFLKSNTNFVLEEPRWLFNESTLNQAITYWPSAWLKRVS